MGDEDTTAYGPDATGNDADDAAAKAAAEAAAAAAAAGSTGSTETKPDADDAGKDWETRFKGLQPKYQTLVEARKAEQTAWENEKLRLMGKVAELETELEARQTSLADITKQFESATTSNEETKKVVDDLEKQLERNALVMSKYPDLALLEAKGLLPMDKEGDELIKALDDMRSILGQTGQKMVQDLTVGSTEDGSTSTGSRTQGDDLTSIQDKLMEANKSGDAAEIKRLTDLLIAAQDKIYAAQEPYKDSVV